MRNNATRAPAGRARTLGFIVAAAILAFGVAFAWPGGSQEVNSDFPSSIELAQAFTATLNGHDVNALLELFTDELYGPSIHADAYAWQRYEIRLWAEQQAW